MQVFKQFFLLLDRGLAWIVIGFIRLYQFTLSPDKGLLSFFLKGRICTHEPHCSEYGLKCFKRYGFWHGLPKISDRVLHCTPSMQKIYDPEHYRVVFFSSAPIGVPFLEALAADKRFEVVGVVTQENKPVGRGLKLTPNIIKQTALDLGLSSEEIQTPQKINPDLSLEGKNFFDRLESRKADFFVVIAYGKLMPQSLLDLPIFGAINVHGSLLPKYRGASPLQSVFLADEQQSWITIMHMDVGMDTGAMIDKLAFKLPFEWTVKDLIAKIQKSWPQFLSDTLRSYAKGVLQVQPQNEQHATHCQKISKQEGEIQPSKDPLAEVYAKYRGYFLRPKVWFTLYEKKVVIEELVLDEVLFSETKDQPLRDNHFQLNPCVKSLSLKPEGKKAMDFQSFKNGYVKK